MKITWGDWGLQSGRGCYRNRWYSKGRRLCTNRAEKGAMNCAPTRWAGWMVTRGGEMIAMDDYVVDVLMRDLVGHDRRTVCFLVYVWLTAECGRRGGEVEVSYREMAESIGVSKSSVQG